MITSLNLLFIFICNANCTYFNFEEELYNFVFLHRNSNCELSVEEDVYIKELKSIYFEYKNSGIKEKKFNTYHEFLTPIDSSNNQLADIIEKSKKIPIKRKKLHDNIVLVCNDKINIREELPLSKKIKISLENENLESFGQEKLKILKDRKYACVLNVLASEINAVLNIKEGLIISKNVDFETKTKFIFFMNEFVRHLDETIIYIKLKFNGIKLITMKDINSDDNILKTRKNILSIFTTLFILNVFKRPLVFRFLSKLEFLYYNESLIEEKKLSVKKKSLYKFKKTVVWLSIISIEMFITIQTQFLDEYRKIHSIFYEQKRSQLTRKKTKDRIANDNICYLSLVKIRKLYFSSYIYSVHQFYLRLYFCLCIRPNITKFKINMKKLRNIILNQSNEKEKYLPSKNNKLLKIKKKINKSEKLVTINKSEYDIDVFDEIEFTNDLSIFKKIETFFSDEIFSNYTIFSIYELIDMAE